MSEFKLVLGETDTQKEKTAEFKLVLDETDTQKEKTPEFRLILDQEETDKQISVVEKQEQTKDPRKEEAEKQIKTSDKIVEIKTPETIANDEKREAEKQIKTKTSVEKETKTSDKEVKPLENLKLLPGSKQTDIPSFAIEQFDKLFPELKQKEKEKETKQTIAKISPSFIKESWTVKDIIEKCGLPGYESVINEAEDEISQISSLLEKKEVDGEKYYPLKKHLFQAFYDTSNPIVVIVGQDPYYQLNEETGLPRAIGRSFAVSEDDKPPKSLINIFRVLKKTIPNFRNAGSKGRTLASWAKQGVQCLNICLTVQPGKAKSHGDLWFPFISKVIEFYEKKNPPMIYVLWGKPAQRLSIYIKKGKVLTCCHPAERTGDEFFKTCNNFNEINEILLKRGQVPIDWNLDK